MFSSDTKKRQFLNRLSGEIAKRGIIDVLRNGVKVYPADLIMLYLTPTENNEQARIKYEKNIFSVTRQLHYSQDAGKLALDVCLFINGLPVITMELKNQLTKQNTEYAVRQYKEDRDFHDLLFSFKRCMVHFAVDDAMIQFCTKLAGKDSWFLPFNALNKGKTINDFKTLLQEKYPDLLLYLKPSSYLSGEVKEYMAAYKSSKIADTFSLELSRTAGQIDCLEFNARGSIFIRSKSQ